MKRRHIHIAMLCIALAVCLAALFFGAPALFAERAETPFVASRTYRFYIGLNDKDANARLISVDEAKQRLNEAAMKHASGFTVREAQGFWRDEHGRTFSEDALIYDFLDLAEPELAVIMEEMRAVMNQEAILVERVETGVMLHRAPARAR